MDRSEVINIARMRLGFNSNLLEAYFTQTLDFVQELYEGSEGRMPLPWFLFDGTYTVPTVASVRTVAAPDDFLAFDENWKPTLVYGTGEFELVRRTQAELAPFYADNGRPKYYAFDGLLFHLYGLPDQVYTIKIPCYRRSAKLSETEDSLWFKFFPTLMVEELVYHMAMSTRDEMALKTSKVSQERDAYRVRVEAMKHQLMSYMMGGQDPIGGIDGA